MKSPPAVGGFFVYDNCTIADVTGAKIEIAMIAIMPPTNTINIGSISEIVALICSSSS